MKSNITPEKMLGEFRRSMAMTGDSKRDIAAGRILIRDIGKTAGGNLIIETANTQEQLDDFIEWARRRYSVQCILDSNGDFAFYRTII